jgi:hypothetical protein
MEKKLYELNINEALEHVMPPLQDLELELLTKSLLTEGCRDPLVVWNGVIVDGHNRYRICREHGIPFCYIEQEFPSESAAKLWIIRNQLARRNVPDFVRCELVLPLEAELKAEAKKRQGQRNDLKNILVNLPECSGQTTRDKLASMAGVSGKTFDRAKKIIREADEATKERLRNGDGTIYGAYSTLTGKKPTEKRAKPSDESEALTSHVSALPVKPQRSADQSSVPLSSEDSTSDKVSAQKEQLIPANYRQDESESPRRDTDVYGIGNVIQSLPVVGYIRPEDSVYDTPPIEVFGNMPSDNLELRGRAELVHARSDLECSTKYFVRRVGEIMRGMSSASRNEENLQMLREIVASSYEQIMELMK